MARAADNAKIETGERERLVAEAAGRLELSEIEVFRLAHRWWFGREPAPEALERVFAAYMFRREVPAWARHYARELLGAGEIGPAQARRLGLDRLPGPPAAPRHGGLIVSAAGAAFLAFFLAILGTTYDPGTSAPVAAEPQRLSCAGGGPGLVFLEELAYGFAGRTPPEC
jgi:hypothetical protein